MFGDKIEKLYRLLREEEALLGKMCLAADEKRDALIAVKAREIEAETRREEGLFRALEAKERVRVELFHEIADALGMEGEISVEAIAASSGEPHATRLMDARRCMAESAAEMKKKNGLNAQLAAQSLSHVHGILGLIARGGEETTYPGPKGRNPEKRVSSLVVDRRV